MNRRAIHLFRYYPDRLFRRILVANGFKSSYITTSIARHHLYSYKGKGKLPPLVILHGGGDSAGSYLPVLLRLKKDFSHIIAIESAGHGLSEELALATVYDFKAHYHSVNEVLDTVISEREPAILMGNSLGGLTALKYALHAPRRVKGLFLLSPMGAPMTEAMLKDLYTIFTPKDLSDVDAFIGRIYHQIPKLKRPIVRRLTFAWITRRAIRDLVESTTTSEGITATELRKIKQPVHMICGQADQIMTPNAQDFFRENISDLVIETPAKLGHCPHLESSKLIADEVKKFAVYTASKVN